MKELKKYEEPEMMIKHLPFSDAIVTSGESPNGGNGNGEGDIGANGIGNP